jgi:AraC-like DNA-binding protein
MLHARDVRHKFSCHAHSEFVIAGVLEGAESFRHEGRDITAPEGSMILLNPYAEHTGHATGVAWSYVAIYPPSAFVYQSLHGDMRARGGGSLRFKYPIVRDPGLLRQLVALYFAVKSKSAELATQALFADFMFDLAARHGTYEPANASRFEPAVRTVRERLDADPADNADLAALAAAGGISPLQLLRAFRLSVGCTPQIYRTVQRLRHAKRALIQGQPLAEAAVGAGFYDQSHFTRVFRRWTGSAPGSFTKSVQLGARGGAT